MRPARTYLTYSNVMATIAVVVALGGTSYAALSLPRDSVRARELAAGAVRGAEVKNGSLGAKELSARARRSLRGAAGATGPQGPAGPATPQYFAVVSAGGERLAGNATQGGLSGVGSYTVGFARSMAGCAATATLGTADGSTTAAGRITVNIVNGSVGVQTYAADGTAANLPFHLVAAC